jgi:RNA polymerase sigma-70 factor (ECF subfamily)
MARECVHDVLLHLWKRKGAYDRRRGALEAFLVTCTRNQALTMMRNNLRQQRLLERLDPPQEYIMEDDPIEKERVMRALSRLPLEQAEAVRLAYYRGFTLAQAAAECNVPLGTIKSRISSALRNLRTSLVTERAR